MKYALAPIEKKFPFVSEWYVCAVLCYSRHSEMISSDDNDCVDDCNDDHIA